MVIGAFIVIASLGSNCYAQDKESIALRENVTLKEAHIGSTEIDIRLLDSYGEVPTNIRQFYLEAREEFSAHDASFTSDAIIDAARNNGVMMMGGPMLGDLKDGGVSIWLRPASTNTLTIKVLKPDGDEMKQITIKPAVAGKEQRVKLNGLSSASEYKYVILSDNKTIAEGAFSTAPSVDEKSQVRLTFGSCFHKIGLHNPNLINAILNRQPNAMLLLGDIAVDDRENKFSMHRSDYLLRDVSQAWKRLSANVPLYASWDDHDYLNNDLSGIPESFTANDIDELRKIWYQNWNNPHNDNEGIYFNTRIGQVEIIMLDTRSCRELERKGLYGSYLGKDQLKWLKKTLKKSTAPFKIISSGTMWSDDISNGKDSWGIWDKPAREEIFSLIEREKIPGVLLISGDRHGARGFTIPRPSGYKLYEFEAATLGGVPGPNAMAKDQVNQIFGYHGKGLRAFGEFTFSAEGPEPQVTFRLINEFGDILGEHVISYTQLTPR